MSKDIQKSQNKGIFTIFKSMLVKNRIGELLVLNGNLSKNQLRKALLLQKQSQAPLGRVLIENQFVSRTTLYKTLGQQISIRCLALSMGIFVTVSGFGVKNARAGTIKDVPAKISLVSAAQPAFTSKVSYPKIFNSDEKRSSDISPFTKWTGMFERFESALYQPKGQKIVSQWQRDISKFQNLPLDEMAKKVDQYINSKTYIVDNRNYGKSDYWSTPIEFFERGGDCEDFAIAKYASLRALGVPEDRLRVAIVHDLEKDIPHAVLIVYADHGALILDNQSQRTRNARSVNRYRPIFSINQQAWWLHTESAPTRVASVQ